MIALLVTIRIQPQHREAFMEAMLDDARHSVQDEPGCLRFDVLEDVDDPSRIFLYEVYRDEEALEAHRQAPHSETRTPALEARNSQLVRR